MRLPGLMLAVTIGFMVVLATGGFQHLCAVYGGTMFILCGLNLLEDWHETHSSS